MDRRSRGYYKRYGLTVEDYDRMLSEQEGCCSICGKHRRQLTYRLHVDHDHKTGEVRALLCQHCNHLLGNAFDSIEILKNAILYIEKHKKDPFSWTPK